MSAKLAVHNTGCTVKQTQPGKVESLLFSLAPSDKWMQTETTEDPGGEKTINEASAEGVLHNFPFLLSFLMPDMTFESRGTARFLTSENNKLLCVISLFSNMLQNKWLYHNSIC